MNSEQHSRESGQNALKVLVDSLVRERGGARSLLKDLKERVEREYHEAIASSAFDLTPVSTALTETMAEFAPGVEIKVDWLPGAGLRISEPTAGVLLTEGGNTSTPEYKGHGLLRAYELSVLALMSERAKAIATEDKQTEAAGDDSISPTRCLIVGIDEPELYQHPAQARLVAARLISLAGSQLGQSRVQVLCTSHSPLFVTLDQCESIRVVRRGDGGRLQGDTRIAQPLFSRMADALRMVSANPHEIKTEGLRARMSHYFHPTLTEAVFADFVVLVEGIEDLAFLEGLLDLSGRSETLRRMGVFIVPVVGKPNLDRMILLLRELNVPHYVIFDTDYDKNPADESVTNCRIVSLCRNTLVEDVPAATEVHDSYTAFHPNLTEHLKNTFGASEWLAARKLVADKLGYSQPSKATKNPRVVREMLEILCAGEKGIDAVMPLVNAICRSAGVIQWSLRGPSPFVASELDSPMTEASNTEVEQRENSLEQR